MDIASLIIGIFAVIIGFIPCLQVFVILPGIVGLILGIVSYAKKRREELSPGIALAGIILNAIPLIYMLIIALFVGFSANAFSINDMIIK
jgi:hypothetical protein